LREEGTLGCDNEVSHTCLAASVASA